MNDLLQQRDTLKSAIDQHSPERFADLALEVFRYQARSNKVYAHYLELLSVDVGQVTTLTQIPALPISLFKTHEIKSGDWSAERIFSSSGTTGSQTSRHKVRDLKAYLDNTVRGFTQFYGPPSNYCVLALLPAYLERQGSSLVEMAQHFINLSKYPASGFFLYNYEALAQRLDDCLQKQIPTLLLGVSFALLDFAEQYARPLEQVIIMETGGMKGRRKELTREQLHDTLKSAFSIAGIHSEYGMTELMSQAYAKHQGRFYPSNSMRVWTREITDPFQPQAYSKVGVLNIIDLANLDTCSFIATDDLGRVYEDGSFEVLGRLDHSDIRGCNLMVADV